MAELGHTFEEVHLSKNDMEFNVCVIRIWEVSVKFNPNEIQSLKMVVQDHKGQRIHVGVGKGLVKKLKPRVREFQICKMTSPISFQKCL
ncbi:hypothetical protein PIB30_018969 [Stylosanthes scabra]|uniref:Replication protein A 70 kDa DNA-binding subunit B/D first OB fold domain-containing protein n=1 Tax=Stylosanthes scabra TaxID=79078 RepID=A0ABU6Z5I6_9FABA|nr:hypothetical protein [Stylosanthes scabra]